MQALQKKCFFKLLILGTSIFICTFSCKIKKNSSYAQHTFGTTFAKRTTPLQDCHKLHSFQKNNKTQVAQQYAENMLTYLTSHSPETFSGVLQRSVFCISIITDDSINASADSKNGLITIHSGLFSVDNDAMIAGVLAHELAHVTLNHENKYNEHTFSYLSSEEFLKVSDLTKRINSLELQIESTKEKLKELMVEKNNDDTSQPPDNLSVDERIDWMINNSLKRGECIKNCDEYKRLMRLLMLSFVELNENIKAQKSILKTKYNDEEIANKAEADADEVAIEFLVRADINPNFMATYDLLIAVLSGELIECWDGSKLLLDQPMKRGTESHPSACWRIQNDKAEIQKHKNEYSKYLQKNQKFFMDSPSLKDVKNSLGFK